VVPPPPTTLRATKRYKSSRRAGKNWPKRPLGVSKRNPPEGTACVFMPSSSYKLVFRIFLTKGFNLTTRDILDTRSGPTLISRQLLPDDTQLQPLGEWASMFHDVNGGWLPIVSSVCLGVALGGQISYVYFGDVDNMSVPDILGAFFMDIATKNIATQEQHVELLNGTKVPGPVLCIVFSFGHSILESFNSDTSAGHLSPHVYQYNIYIEKTGTNQFRNGSNLISCQPLAARRTIVPKHAGTVWSRDLTRLLRF